MKAIILAAGEGNRMRPLTYTQPKSMLPVYNKPLIEHLLLAAIEAGISEFIFVVGYHEEKVRQYFGNGEKWGVRIEYCLQRNQYGTGDAVATVRPLMDGNPFLTMNGDIVITADTIKRMIKHQDMVIGVKEVQNTRGLGLLEFDGNRIIRFHEKTESPPSNMANAGIYLLTEDIFDVIAQTPKSVRGEYEITDSLQMLIDSGHHVYYQQLTDWVDLSYPWDLLNVNDQMMSHVKTEINGIVEDYVVIKGEVSVGWGTVIKSGSYLVGPIAIGENCVIGPNCYIRSYTTIGDSCHVGAACEIKNSIIMKNSKLPHLNYVGDTIIGENCNLGAGTQIANLRYDHHNVKAGSVDTQRRKLGAIIGSHVHTGINSNINVGTMIGNDTFIYPGVTVNGVIPPNSRILVDMYSQMAVTNNIEGVYHRERIPQFVK